MTLEQMRYWKDYLGYSNKMLAEKSGVPLGTVQKVLSGETRVPRYKTIKALERALDQGVEESDRYRMDIERWGLDRLFGADHVRENGAGQEYAGYEAEREEVPDVIEDAWSGRWRRQGTYTVRDYESIPDEVRVELIDGVIYDMASPTVIHQLIIGEVFIAMYSYRERTGREDCLPLMSPLDVELDNDERTIVQPDILVICRKSGQTLGKRIYGAPDFVLEVLSPSTRKKDMQTKAHKYASAGVREYWIIDPDEQTILVYDFEHLRFPVTYTFNDRVPVMISGGELEIDFSRVREVIETNI